MFSRKRLAKGDEVTGPEVARLATRATFLEVID